mgnify:FL=1
MTSPPGSKYMMTGDKPTQAAVRGLETYLNTVIDHGLNALTFTARVVVSAESDVVSAVTAAVGTLKGSLHGGAPGPVGGTTRSGSIPAWRYRLMMLYGL